MSYPLGFQQLMSCNEVTMEHKMKFFKIAYSVTAPHFGKILKVSGAFNFKVRDSKDTVIATFRMSHTWVNRETMTVTLCDSPPLLVKPKNTFSATICIIEHEQPVLRLKQANIMGSKFNILDRNDVAIGTVKKSWGNYTIKFPQDLDSRYKTGLLAACVYEYCDTQKRSSS